MFQKSSNQEDCLNVIVMTDAGKVIFSRYDHDDDDEEEEDLSSFCGFVQAIRGSMLNDSSLNHGDIQCINANKSRISFMHVGCITLVAIAKKQRRFTARIKSKSRANTNGSHDDDDLDSDEDLYPESYYDNDNYWQYHTEAILKLHLEVLYKGIIFTLTDCVQYLLEENPNLDIREILGSSTKVLRNVLDDMSYNGDQSCLFLGGVDTFGPIPNEIRDYTSNVLCQTCSRSKSIIYTILSVNKKLFNIIQPQSKQHQLQHFDINLLLHFINSQTQTIHNELWFPICLPSLDESGFVHGYQCCLTDSSGMESFKLTIISTDPSIEEFERLRHVAKDIRLELGLADESNNDQILRIYNLDRSQKEDVALITDNNLIWERTSLYKDNEFNGRVDTSSHKKARFGCEMVRYVRQALHSDYQKKIIQSYFEVSSLIHFVFRYTVPIRNYETGSITDGGSLPQCYNSTMTFVDKHVSKTQIWNAYQQLCIRLRTSSPSSQESMKALGDLQQVSSNTKKKDESTLQGNWRPSQSLFQLRSKEGTFSYIVEGKYLFLTVVGTNYELYATFLASTLPSHANTLCEVLIGILLNDAKDLLQCKPLSF